MTLEPLVIRNPGLSKKTLGDVIVFLESGFVTSEVPMRFSELMMFLTESEKRDLQF